MSLPALPPQCHTNVISVFSELEQQPLLFPTPASLAAAAARDAALRQQRASGYESLPSPRSLRALSGSQRRLKSSKLVGMLSVVACSTGITALLYSATGARGLQALGLAAIPTAVLPPVMRPAPPPPPPPLSSAGRFSPAYPAACHGQACAATWRSQPMRHRTSCFHLGSRTR